MSNEFMVVIVGINYMIFLANSLLLLKIMKEIREYQIKQIEYAIVQPNPNYKKE